MVAVPNIFTRNQLEVRFRSTIESSLAGFYGRPVQLAVIVDDTLGAASRPSDFDDGSDHVTLSGAGSDRAPGQPAEPRAQRRPESAAPRLSGGHRDPGSFRDLDAYRPRREADARLNPKYTFETFVIG